MPVADGACPLPPASSSAVLGTVPKSLPANTGRRRSALPRLPAREMRWECDPLSVGARCSLSRGGEGQRDPPKTKAGCLLLPPPVAVVSGAAAGGNQRAAGPFSTALPAGSVLYSPSSAAQQGWHDVSRQQGEAARAALRSTHPRAASGTHHSRSSRPNRAHASTARRVRRKPLEVGKLPVFDSGDGCRDEDAVDPSRVEESAETGGGIKGQQLDCEQDEPHALCHIPLPPRKRKLSPELAKMILETGLVIRPALHPPVIHPALQARASHEGSCRDVDVAKVYPVAGYGSKFADCPTGPLVTEVKRSPSPFTGCSLAEGEEGVYSLDQPAPLGITKGHLEKEDTPSSSAYPLGGFESPLPGTAGTLSPDYGAASVSSFGTGGGPGSRETSVSSLSTADAASSTPLSDWGVGKAGDEPRAARARARPRNAGAGAAEGLKQRGPSPGASSSSPAPSRSSSASAGLGDRRHKCGTCPAAFARGHDLRRHETTHTKIRDHECSGCGRRVSRRDALQRHAGVCCRPNKVAGTGADAGTAAKKAELSAMRSDAAFPRAKRAKVSR
ncbi:MAG: hypothetical protein BJ554DRAFT_6369 [Olpidium bornovanus]|uniref:C2H2-type domain-containing protein n=1 Tax=Olpidium bornovanus TaxID=278681 RepID=A0A8H7ZXW2_9FUNG|nr:MAG: hypothetical protein BJ554DRAFT_6369 [Olpidium bornovanus]